MEKVKRLIDAGCSVPTAIKEALGMPLGVFADRYHVARGVMSDVINLARRPTDEQVDALIAELGGTRDEWRWFLWVAARPLPAGDVADATAATP